MELFKHQSSAVEHSKKSPFLLIIRSPGTGKTLIGTTIAQEELQNNAHAKILWIGPANLENQYKNVFDTLALPYNSVSSARNIKSGCCNICSFDILRLHEPLFCNMNWDLVLIDEVHKAKNSATKTNIIVLKEMMLNMITLFTLFEATVLLSTMILGRKMLPRMSMRHHRQKRRRWR